MFQSSDYLDLLKQLEQFFSDSANREQVTRSLSPAELKARLSLSLPTEGKPLSALGEDVARYLSYAVKTAHPGYFNQLWGGFQAACFMGDMLTSATNTSMYTHEVAPVATLIEKTLVAKFCELAGFERGKDSLQQGAAMAI